MNRSFILVASSVLGLSSLAVARDAHALGPIDLEVGAKVGYATNPSSVSGATNPLGFGLGGRAGIAFLGGIYLGGNVMYYLGGSQTVAPPCLAATSCGSPPSVSVNTLMYGGELGYGIKILDLLTIRPQVGLGNATFSESGGGQSQSTSNWYLEPGVTALIGLGLLYVGADANALFFPGLANSQAAFTLHAQIGVKF
jgi:opacity protein-like surface antigen